MDSFFWRPTWLGIFFFSLSTTTTWGWYEPTRSPAAALEQATLNDVAFMDADRGWAVGEQGVVWQTEDGGRSWKLQDVGTTGRIAAIEFVGSQQGVMVGGWSQPYTHSSSAVALQTRDGGQTWKPANVATLPALTDVKFLDERKCWAVGNSSAMYPSGIFRSDDGGRSWTAMQVTDSPGWKTFSLPEAGTGLLLDREGGLAVLLNSKVKPLRTMRTGLNHGRTLKMTSRMNGVLVGEGGMVFTTRDSGATWSPIKQPFSDSAARGFDWNSLATVGDHWWIAGSPGTFILHSADGGASWEKQPTNHSAALRGLTFIDQQRGWAVGELGAILVTRDGGRTWHKQQGGTGQVALLGLFSVPERIPLEPLAQWCGNDGYVGAVDILFRRDLESSDGTEATLDQRTHEAIASTGVSATRLAWEFPLRQRGLELPVEMIVANWEANGAAKLEEFLVRRIRECRPEVIVTDDVRSGEGRNASRLLQQTLLTAVPKAENSAEYPEQITEMGLTAWKVKKVFGISEGEQTGAISVSTGQLAPRLGRSLADISAVGRGLLQPRFALGPSTYCCRLLLNHTPQELGRRDLFSGIVLPAGSDLRRVATSVSSTDLAALQRTAQRQRTVQQLLARSATDAQGGANWLAQVDDLLRGLQPEAAGETLFQLAFTYHHSGKPDLAAEAFNLLMDRYPQHHLVEPSLVWLVQAFSSSEVTRRMPKPLDYEVKPAAAVQFDRVPNVAANSKIPTQSPANKVGRDLFFLKATAAAKSVERLAPPLFAQPSLRFSLASTQRRNGQTQEAEQFFRSLFTARPMCEWANGAAFELSDARKNAEVGKQVYVCKTSTHKPRLDGMLDDTVWQKATRQELRSSLHDDGGWPAIFQLARDEEFLYIAATCHKATGGDYGNTSAPRPRDPDLATRDRVELLLDLDRDYATFFRLTIDHRGWLAEDCYGDASWNPEWFVAATDDAETWTIEAAIPFRELTLTIPASNQSWALGVQRIVPQAGFQSWTQPATIGIRPAGFGILRFE